jgi:YVTN family beta-propeller protein
VSRRQRFRLARTVVVLMTAIVVAVIASRSTGSARQGVVTGLDPGTTARPLSPAATGGADPLPGMPRLIDGNLYAADQAGSFSSTVRRDPSLIYTPNSGGDTVSVINPGSYRVIATYKVGCNPQHVVPSWDLRTLWVLSDDCNSVTEFDPATGRPGESIPVDDPYNMYFTPDGRYAVIVAEARQRLDFREPHTMALVHSIPVTCPGVDHMEFTADGRYAIATCEFSARLVKIDIAREQVVGYLNLQSGAMPQDVRASPDGKVFYVADQTFAGMWEIDPDGFKVTGFVQTGVGTHGLYPSRDGRLLYVTNRGLQSGQGSVAVFSFAAAKVLDLWSIPGRSSPDMGGVSADGRVLWLTGRYNSEVYAIDTTNGRLIGRIAVGVQPHGLAVFPQPGRYSLGHTGEFR